MKSKLYAALFIAALSGCQKKENVKTYLSRPLMTTESFNQYPQQPADSLSIYDLSNIESRGASGSGTKKTFHVKFGDTIVHIQSSLKDKSRTTDLFSSAQFINSQKTSLLVQSADSTGLVAPFYLIALKGRQLDVVSLSRPSNGKADSRFTKGATRIGRSGYLINNDFFVTSVDAKAYFLKRQNTEERIQGIHFMNSPDRHTLVFLVSSSLYQVHYPTGTVYTLPISSKVFAQPGAVFTWIQHNYSWQKNDKGILFLKKNPDDNRIINAKDLRSVRKV